MAKLLKFNKSKLRAERILQEISQQDLAEKAKINQMTISFIETGKTKHPHIDMLLKIAFALNKDIKDFLSVAD